MYFSLNPKTSEAMNMVNIMGVASTIILGIVAISLSIFYYHAGININRSTYDYLSRIESQTTTSAEIVKGILQRVIDIVENIINEKTKVRRREQVVQDELQTRILSTGEQLVDSAGKKLDEIIKATNDKDKEIAKKLFFEEIDKTLKSLRHEVGEAMVLHKSSPTEIISKDYLVELNKDGSLLNYLPTFVRRIRYMESEHKFVAVSWLKNTKFKDDPLSQELLQLALDKSWLLTERVPNPKNPTHPVLACKLNREHPKIREILRVIESKDDLPK
jgi:hypothetical protein